MNGQPRPERLNDLASRVGYCSMTIVDGNPSSRSWQFRYSLDDQANRQQQQQQANQLLTRSFSLGYQPTPLQQYQYFA